MADCCFWLTPEGEAYRFALPLGPKWLWALTWPLFSHLWHVTGNTTYHSQVYGEAQLRFCARLLRKVLCHVQVRGCYERQDFTPPFVYFSCCWLNFHDLKKKSSQVAFDVSFNLIIFFFWGRKQWGRAYSVTHSILNLSWDCPKRCHLWGSP